MVGEGRFQKRHYNRLFIAVLALTTFFYGSYVFAAEDIRSEAEASGLARYRVFPLKHITAEKGKEFLAEAQIGTVSQLPGGNALLVTAQHRELIKASAILRLVDSEESFVFRTIYAGSERQDMPSNEQIAAELGDVSIGTFSEVPEDGEKAKAIIDIHNGAVIAVAPAGQFERIVAAINKLRHSGVKQPPVTEPLEPQPAGPDTNEPFGKLLNLLAEAEKKTEKVAEPAKPAAGDAILHKSGKIELFEPDRDIIEPVAEVEPEPAVAEKKVPAEVPEMVYTPRSYEPNYGRIAEKDLELDLDLPEQLNIVDLMRLVGEYLELDYMYDPAEVKGIVTLKLRGPIKVKDLYPLLESVLKFKGFVMTRKVNLVTIVPEAKAAAIDPAFVDDQTGQPRLGDVIITRIFRLQHIDTTSAKNLLDGMGLGVNINTSLSEAKTLIVTEFAYRMGRIEELLQMIDKPGRKKQFRFRQLKYTVAEKLAPKVKTLADELGTVSVTVSAAPKPAPKPVRGRPAPQPTPTPAGPTTEPTVYLDTDERTNRILMIGLEEQLNAVEALIDVLDVEQQDLRTLRLYEIQHVGAEEVIDKLGALGIISGSPTTAARRANRTTPGKPDAPTTGAADEEPLTEEPQVVLIESTNSLLVNATAEQHAQIAVIIGYVDIEPEEASIPYVVYPLENQDPEELAGVLNQLILKTTTKEDKAGKIVETQKRRAEEEDIVIIPDSKTYSLIVYASKKNQQWISSLIKQLDQYRPQVLLDVTLVEITKDEKFDLDLDATVFSGLPILSLSSTTGAIGGKSVTAFYKAEDVHVLLEALQEKGYGRILARPKLLVNDNEEGTIKSEEQTSVAQIQTKIIPGTATTAPTATQDVGFQSYTAGITLIITPHISKGDQLGLTITLTRTDFRLRDATQITTVVEEEKEQTASYPTPPDLLTSDVTTNVTVPDGATIILGGLERIRQSKGGTKVPLLGDIPFVGGLFRTTSNQDDQSRLYVFVRASIIRPGEVTGLSDIEVVSADNRATFEKYETEMQQYEDWPGFKSKPMDPLKVLETK